MVNAVKLQDGPSRNLPLPAHFEAERHFPLPADLSDGFHANRLRRVASPVSRKVGGGS
jgi:hypothetical protein